METRQAIGLLNNLLLPENQKQAGQQNQIENPKKSRNTHRGDIVTLSGQKPTPNRQDQNNALLQKSSRLLNETIEKNENGFRRTQEFAGADGRKFARIEEVTSSANRTRRIVVQQNTSGNTTILEDVLDRQEDGTFRLTRRYTNEAGETKTNIEFNVTPDSKDIILGRAPDPQQENRSFEPSRGTQFDASA